MGRTFCAMDVAVTAINVNVASAAMGVNPKIKYFCCARATIQRSDPRQCYNAIGDTSTAMERMLHMQSRTS
jgi:hypothetical protein